MNDIRLRSPTTIPSGHDLFDVCLERAVINESLQSASQGTHSTDFSSSELAIE